MYSFFCAWSRPFYDYEDDDDDDDEQAAHHHEQAHQRSTHAAKAHERVESHKQRAMAHTRNAGNARTKGEKALHLAKAAKAQARAEAASKEAATHEYKAGAHRIEAHNAIGHKSMMPSKPQSRFFSLFSKSKKKKQKKQKRTPQQQEEEDGGGVAANEDDNKNNEVEEEEEDQFPRGRKDQKKEGLFQRAKNGLLIAHKTGKGVMKVAGGAAKIVHKGTTLATRAAALATQQTIRGVNATHRAGAELSRAALTGEGREDVFDPR
jgi:hypothetical protein